MIHFVCLSEDIHLSPCIHVYVHVCAVCVYVCMYVHVYACVYVYVCIYVCMFMCICMYIHVCKVFIFGPIHVLYWFLSVLSIIVVI